MNETTMKEVPAPARQEPSKPPLFAVPEKPAPKKRGRPPQAKNKVAAKPAKASAIGAAVADVLIVIENLSPSDRDRVLKIAAKI